MKNRISMTVCILAVLFTVNFVSCIPEPLEIDVPEMEQKIVISSQFLPDSGALVTCMRSFSALSDAYMPNKINLDFINKAFGLQSLVLLEHNNMVDTLYNMGMGMYFNGSVIVGVGEQCKLKVHDSIIEQDASATAYVMQNINFDTAFVNFEIQNNDTTAIIFFDITDLAGDNYYLINHYIYQEGNNQIDYTDFLGENPYAELISEYINDSEIGDMLAQYTNIGNVDNKIKLITDQNFKNTTFRDSVKFYHASANDTLAVSIGNISKDYYDYLTLRMKASTIYSQIMSDPINMPTNVENGLGMFTTHSLNIWLFDLSKITKPTQK